MTQKPEQDTGLPVSGNSSRPRRQRPELTPTQRALVLLVRREHSKKELKQKLEYKGVSSADAQATVEKLTEAGWQDDARFAEQWVRSKVSSGYGPLRIKAELKLHALSASAISSALDTVETSWSALAHEHIRRRFPSAFEQDRAAQRKAADHLLRRGFSMDHVRAALKCDFEDEY